MILQSKCVPLINALHLCRTWLHFTVQDHLLESFLFNETLSLSWSFPLFFLFPFSPTNQHEDLSFGGSTFLYIFICLLLQRNVTSCSIHFWGVFLLWLGPFPLQAPTPPIPPKLGSLNITQQRSLKPPCLFFLFGGNCPLTTDRSPGHNPYQRLTKSTLSMSKLLSF